MSSPRWRKSSKSDTGGSCVELAHTLTAVRDSKNQRGPTLHVPLPAFLAAIRTGRLTR